MPEGPSIVILAEAAKDFAGQEILRAEGNTRLDLTRLLHQRVRAVRSWGKHFLIELDGFSLRIHLLMFGSYRVNERKAESTPRVSLGFANGELNFYTCSARYVEGPLEATYDWSMDVMSPAWSPQAALARLHAMPDALVCDALLDQGVFAGVGNIIKNEVLFRIHVHPLSRVGALPAAKLEELVHEARAYSFDFLRWKKDFVLKQHWLAHTRSICPRCGIPFGKGKLGRTQRRSFYCERCQTRYDTPA